MNFILLESEVFMCRCRSSHRKCSIKKVLLEISHRGKLPPNPKPNPNRNPNPNPNRGQFSSVAIVWHLVSVHAWINLFKAWLVTRHYFETEVIFIKNLLDYMIIQYNTFLNTFAAIGSKDITRQFFNICLLLFACTGTSLTSCKRKSPFFKMESKNRFKT